MHPGGFAGRMHAPEVIHESDACIRGNHASEGIRFRFTFHLPSLGSDWLPSSLISGYMSVAKGIKMCPLHPSIHKHTSPSPFTAHTQDVSHSERNSSQR